MEGMLSRHQQFMSAALEQAGEALRAGEFPVGCVIEYAGKIIASGQRSKSTGRFNEMDHAEITALRQLVASSHQVEMDKVTIYSTMEPCLMCFSTLLVNGVRRFVYSYEDVMGGGTNLPLSMLSPLYRDLQVSILCGILRTESLALFKAFFSSPGCHYLQGTQLAAYTLEQL